MKINLNPIEYPYEPQSVSYAYHLGYTHASSGLNLWYGITDEEIERRRLPSEFGEPDYAKGYEDALDIRKNVV